MDINSKTQQTNSFVKGMNTDGSDAFLGDDEYRLANNLRYITNIEENTAELHMIEGTKEVLTLRKLFVVGADRIEVLNTTLIREYGIIIVRTTSYGPYVVEVGEKLYTCDLIGNEKAWFVFAFKHDEDKAISGYADSDIKLVFGPCTYTIGDNLSLVTKYEDDDNVRLYIADGVNPITSINIASPFVDKDYVALNEYNAITSYPTIVFKLPIFAGLVDGTLPAGVVLYSYLLYNKYGNSTSISPVTKMIPIQKGTSGTNVEGYILGKLSSAGVKLIIPQVGDEFSHLRIFRILYVENGQPPTIEVIQEMSNPHKDLIFVDGGIPGQSVMTVEEYNAISGIHIVPKIIESKGDYLFAANIIKEIDSVVSLEILDWDARAFRYTSDKKLLLNTYGTPDLINDFPEESHDCWNPVNDINTKIEDIENPRIYKSDGKTIGGTGINVSWEFVEFEIVADSNPAYGNDYMHPGMGSTANPISLNETSKFYYGNDNLVYNTSNSAMTLPGVKFTPGRTYSNPTVSYAFKSLRRGELYRYGIILYDDKGNASPVKWIADIRVPYDIKSMLRSHGLNVDLTTTAIGVKFEVNNLPNSVVSYEIVRCPRTSSDIKTLTQGVVSRPIRRYQGVENKKVAYDTYPLTPTGWLTTADYWGGINRYLDYLNIDAENSEWDSWHLWAETNAKLPIRRPFPPYAFGVTKGNLDVFQFVSPEICYLEDSTKTLLKNSDIKIEPITYLFGMSYSSNGSKKPRGESGTDSRIYAVPEYFSNEGYAALFIAQNQLIFPGNIHTKLYVENKKFVLHTGSVIDSKPYTTYDDMFLPNIYNLSSDVITMPVWASILFYYSDPNSSNFGGFADFPIGSNIKESLPILNHDNFYLESLFPSKGGAVPNRHQYIKLYEHATAENVYVHKRMYDDATPIVVEGDDVSVLKRYSATSVGKLINYTDNNNYFPESLIQDVLFSPAIPWDEFAETKKTDTLWPLKYINHQTVVGGDSYVNWVTNGAYGREWDESFNEGQYLNIGYDNSQDNTFAHDNFIMGPAGKCMLLKIKDKYNPVLSFSCGVLSTDRQGYPDVRVDYMLTNSQEKLYIYPESRVGTYLCNITHTVLPYGGFTYLARLANTYQSYGDYFSADTKDAIVFDGDCYVLAFEYISQHKFEHPAQPYPKNTCIVYAIPVESSINLALTSGVEFHKNDTPTYVQDQPGDMNGKYAQTKPLYEYNSVYSQNSTISPHASQVDMDTYDQNFDTRCFYSNPKSNNEYFDSWLVFMPSNYIDVDTRRGQITQLANFNNRLIFWQKFGVGMLSVEERTTLTDESNMPLMLGSGGVLSRYDYFNGENGMRENEFTNTQSSNTLYWWDHEHQELCSYSDGLVVVPLSKMKNVQNFINKQAQNGLLTDTPHLFFDQKYNDVIANISHGIGKEAGSLVYNEQLNAFTSLYGLNAQFDIRLQDKIYLLNEQKDNENDIGKIHVWNPVVNKIDDIKAFDNYLYPYLKYVTNSNYSIPKVFDNVSFGGRFYGGERNVINSRLSFIFNTPLKQTAASSNGDIENREYDFRLAVPRNENSLYGDRLRGKTMLCELVSNSSSYDFSLQYITTKYRISWS